MDLAPVVRFAAEHRRWFLAAGLVLTILLAPGLARLRMETGLLDWLPRRHPNIEAFRELIQKLPGVLNQELIWLELDPEKAALLGVESITDHQSFQAQEELLAYVRERVPEVTGSFGVLSWMRAFHQGLSRSSQSSDTFLKSAAETQRLFKLFEATAGKLEDALLARNRRGTVLALMLDAPPLSQRAREIGAAVRSALDSYKTGALRRDLFREEYLVPAGISSGLAEIDRSLERDLYRLSPFATAFLLLTLVWALRSLRQLVLVLALLAIGVLWTLGLMGWCGTALNIVNIALVPLLLGCGIDYALLVCLDVRDHRAGGRSPEQTLESVGRGSATAVLLTTLTTAAGLLALVFSDAPGMVGLGAHAAAGMLLLAVLSTCFLPGALVRRTFPMRRRPTFFRKIVGEAIGFFARRRHVGLSLHAALVIAALLLVQKPVVMMDVIAGNYPPGAPITNTVERIRTECGGAFPEIIIARGNLSSPDAMEILKRLEQKIADSETLGKFHPVGLPDLIVGHRLMESRWALGFLTAVGQGLPAEGLQRMARELTPATREAIRSSVESLHNDDGWKSMAGMFVDTEAKVGTILLMGGDADADADADAVASLWRELETLVAGVEAEGQPHDSDVLELSFLGYRTMSYLFTEYSMRWIRVTAVVSLLTVLVLAALFLRELRALLVVVLLAVTSGILWFALLQVAGIYVSIFLLFPLVFALSIGSDYGLHVLCRLRASPEAGEHSFWASIGRAIAIAALTDAGVFVIYSPMKIVSASHVMTAVALAVVAVFASTALLVPALALRKARGGDAP